MLTIWPEPRAHAGQHRAGEGHQAEEIGLELGATGFVLALLEGGQIAIARIVDEHVDLACGLERREDVLGAGHVQFQGMGMGVPGDQIRDLFGLAGAGEHRVAARDQRFGQSPAKTGRAARDEPAAGEWGMMMVLRTDGRGRPPMRRTASFPVGGRCKL
jgi:hypothetical protein